MTVAINKRSDAGAFAFLKSKTEWMEISDYYVGDIHTDKPVSILAGATVVGNVFAPEVRVTGLLYGTAVSHNITINADGLVWSNVYAVRLQIEEGGKIQGFVSSIDAAMCDMLSDIGNPNDLPPISFQKEIPNGIAAANVLPQPTPDQLDALTRLQAEAGVALAARAELEHSFETRITEMVGVTQTRATILDKKAQESTENLMAVSQQLGEVQSLSQTQAEQIQRLSSELDLKHQLLQEKTGEWEKLTVVYNQQTLDYEQLQAKKAEMDIAFHIQMQELDDLTERTTGLETALQAGLQHSGEQEDALVRWQELGETRQARVDELERELEVAAFKIEENGRLTEMLRAQRQEVEDSWQISDNKLKKTAALLAALTIKHESTEKKAEKTTSQLATNQDEIETLWQQISTLEAERETTVSNMQDSSQLIQELHQKLQAQEAELDTVTANLAETAIALEKFNDKQTEQLSAQTAVIMAEADKTIDVLKQKLADTEQQQAEKNEQLSAQTAVIMAEANKTINALKQQKTVQAEQLSWHKLSLKTARTELDQARQTITEQGNIQDETAVSQSEHDGIIAELQQKIEQYEFALADVEEQFATLQADLAAKQEEVDALKEMKEALRRTRLQLKANEGEIEKYLAEMDRQGHHLADIQSTLIEREIQLQQMSETAKKQAAFIKRMKQVASERIQKLQQQLAEK